jgi:hypothetical protein
VSVKFAAYIVQWIGLALLLIFGMPWKGRAPRNKAFGFMGAVLMLVAAIYVLVLLLSEPAGLART